MKTHLYGGHTSLWGGGGGGRDIYHLFTETEGNSVFCGPETVDVSRGEAEGKIDGRGSTKHTAFPRSQ